MLTSVWTQTAAAVYIHQKALKDTDIELENEIKLERQIIFLARNFSAGIESEWLTFVPAFANFLLNMIELLIVQITQHRIRYLMITVFNVANMTLNI